MIHKVLKVIAYIAITIFLLTTVSSIFNGLDEGLSLIFTMILFMYPWVVYLVWRFKVEKSLKNVDENGEVEKYKFKKSQKVVLFLVVPLLILVGMSMSPSYSKVTDVEIASIENKDVLTYEEKLDNYSPSYMIVNLVTDGGEFFFNNNVTIKSLTDKNHPYNKGVKFELIADDSELDQINPGKTRYIMGTDRLTNGKYELELVAYTTNVEGKSEEEIAKKSFVIKKEFTVDNTFDSRDDFLTFHDNYIKEMEEKEKAEEEKRKEEERADKERRKKEGVSIGMTQEEVLMSSWGKPDKINRTTNSYGVSEQWVYRYRVSGYLYFDDGILTSIQN